MLINILEYIGIIALILTAIAAYNQYKAGKFFKNNKENENTTKKQSKFQQWWMKSYIREIYRVRASQRKLMCFLPWIGVWGSLFFVFVFIVFSYINIFHPLQPFEKLKKYEGVITNYIYHRKSDDTLQIKLKDGTIKNLHAHISGKNIKERYIDKKVMVLTQKDWGIFDLGYYEKMVRIDTIDTSLDTVYQKYNKRYKIFQSNKYEWFEYIFLSLKWLLGCLALLWFINRNPIPTTNKINKKA